MRNRSRRRIELMTAAITNHLWQSTVFAGLAWVLTLALKGNRAQVRYGVWLVASSGEADGELGAHV
jgi:hypothetical protein